MTRERIIIGGLAFASMFGVLWLDWHFETHVGSCLLLTVAGLIALSEFMALLRKAWGTRIGLPATAWMLEIGARFLRTETELILKSRRVTPGRLLQSGFVFEYPTWKEASMQLCTDWRDRKAK